VDRQSRDYADTQRWIIWKFNGRDGQIRTADPSHPKRVLYQAEPRPDDGEARVLLRRVYQESLSRCLFLLSRLEAGHDARVSAEHVILIEGEDVHLRFVGAPNRKTEVPLKKRRN
jgi:hypothetical protein